MDGEEVKDVCGLKGMVYVFDEVIVLVGWVVFGEVCSCNVGWFGEVLEFMLIEFGKVIMVEVDVEDFEYVGKVVFIRGVED